MKLLSQANISAPPRYSGPARTEEAPFRFPRISTRPDLADVPNWDWPPSISSEDASSAGSAQRAWEERSFAERARPLRAARDFTTTDTATSGGNVFQKITLANNFEANHGTDVFPDGYLDQLDDAMPPPSDAEDASSGG